MAETRGTYNTTAPTLTDGQYGSIQLDAKGSIKVRLADAAGAFLDAFAGNTSGLYVQGNVASGVADAGNPLKIGVKATTGSLTTYTNGQRADVAADLYGNIRVSPVVVSLAAADGVSNSTYGAFYKWDSDASGYRIGVYPSTFNGSTWDRVIKSNAVSRIASAANSTNATSAKASAGNVHNIQAYNASAAVKYLKLYNKASAPTVGTDVPVMTLAIGPSQQLSVSFANGHYFSTGIAYALTGAAADADTTALTAADVVGLSIAYS